MILGRCIDLSTHYNTLLWQCFVCFLILCAAGCFSQHQKHTCMLPQLYVLLTLARSWCNPLHNSCCWGAPWTVAIPRLFLRWLFQKVGVRPAVRFSSVTTHAALSSKLTTCFWCSFFVSLCSCRGFTSRLSVSFSVQGPPNKSALFMRHRGRSTGSDV